jgi:4-amino-4-deoxy-L-arabinose transferase-like glycosyltransferase
MDRPTRAVLWLILLLSGVLGFFALDRSPTIWFDEAAYLEPAWRLATTGSLRSYSQFDGGELGMPFVGQVPLYSFFQAGVIKTIGLSVWTMRGSGVLLCLLSALLLFRILRRRLGDHAALVGVALVLFHPVVIAAMRSGRMDALAMALGCSSLVAFDRLAQKGLLRWAVLGGVLMGLAILTHPAVAALVPAAVWLSRSESDPSFRRWMTSLATAAVAGTLCLAPWLVYITWIAPQAYREQLGAAAELFQQRELSRLALWFLRTRELIEGFRFFFLGVLAVPTALLITGLSRRMRPWMLVGAAAIGFHVFVMRGTITGQSHVICALTFTVAAAARDLEERVRLLQRRRLALAVLGGLFLVNGLSVPGARAYVAARQFASRSPSDFARQWDAAIPAAATVAGPAYAFYAATRHNGNYRCISQLFPWKDPQQRWYREALCRAKLDYVVVPAGTKPSAFLAVDCPDGFSLTSRIRLPRAPIEGLVVESYDSDVYRRDGQTTRAHD